MDNIVQNNIDTKVEEIPDIRSEQCKQNEWLYNEQKT